MSPFSEGASALVRQEDDENWIVEEPIRYTGRVDTFKVPVGSGTDFASVPRPFVWFLPRYGAYTMAAILHDYLWRQLASNGKIDWVDADGIFRRAMRELRVPFLRRWIMWSAVRWGALFKPGGRKGWLRESWRVILFTFVALPFVIPPGVVILVSILLFTLVEFLIFGGLWAGSAAKSKVTKRPVEKPAAAPNVGLKTSA